MSPTIVTAAIDVMTADSLKLSSAPAGAGMLASTTTASLPLTADRATKNEAYKIGLLAAALADQGMLVLVQHRVDSDRYQYIGVRTETPAAEFSHPAEMPPETALALGITSKSEGNWHVEDRQELERQRRAISRLGTRRCARRAE